MPVSPFAVALSEVHHFYPKHQSVYVLKRKSKVAPFALDVIARVSVVAGAEPDYKQEQSETE